MQNLTLLKMPFLMIFYFCDTFLSSWRPLVSSIQRRHCVKSSAAAAKVSDSLKWNLIHVGPLSSEREVRPQQKRGRSLHTARPKWLATPTRRDSDSANICCKTELQRSQLICSTVLSKRRANCLINLLKLTWDQQKMVSHTYRVVVNGLVYGYGQFKFCWDVTRYVGAVAEKPTKIDSFQCFWRGLPNIAADCSGACGQIWLKF